MTWEEFYGRCYDILVSMGGANDDPRDKDCFVKTFMQESPEHYEYRFCGHFGFGGKFWRGHRKVRVDYYAEDRTPELDDLKEKINKDLLSLQGEVVGSNVGLFGPPNRHQSYMDRFYRQEEL